MTWFEIIIFILALVLMLAGLIGVVLPIIPGIPMIFAVALVYAVIDGFNTISAGTIGLFAILTGVALLLDYLVTAFGIKKMGGTYFGVFGSIIGMALGFIFAGGVIGLVLGAFAGAVVFEMLLGKESRQALKAGLGTFIGFFVGGILKFAIAAAMIGIFAWKVLGR